MRAPAPEAAIEEASCRLRRLFVADNVISWNEQGAGASSPKKKLAAAIRLVEVALGEAEQALGPNADAIPLIKLAREAAIPELRLALPSKGRHGRHRDLNASRDQTIAETVVSIHEQFGLSQERASSAVSEALKRLVSEHRKALKRFKQMGADAAWIDEYQDSVVDKLGLSKDSVKGIVKRCK
jgi:hypothetical protein